MLENFSSAIKHYFLPHNTNNYRAKTLHHQYLLFYIFLLLIFQSLYLFVKNADQAVLGYATDITVDKILTLVNLERKNEGLLTLTVSPELFQAAEKKATDMFDKNYWAHISPTGTTPWEYITSSGYQYLYAGENLAKSFDTADQVVSAWMKSPTHRANILKPEYTEIGLSVKNGVLNGEETTLVVQEFGSRARSPVISDNTVLPQVKESLTVRAGLPAGQAGINNQKPAVPIIKNYRTISFIIAEFMLVVLLIDGIFIIKNKTVRVSGHSLAHVMFLLALIGAMSATGIGAIL